MDEKKWLTPAEAARRLGCGSQNVIRLCKTGALRYTWTPLGRVIDGESLDALICERRKSDSETILV